ncbi:unnamed protein product [Parascedosporium putredinis]|uniref:Metallo-beta-lactamase domain-containing protein n=1 Tax=Parascedosporium putredinis TaxID=1442378 RepID=A0A9P1MCL6_9PEZI|nr:unnamed protein product [Parascedosporium putredinis]CAI7996828.1 unnamed protein product [Parascedosporium putredinis]
MTGISAPPSDSIVRVRLINTTGLMTVRAQGFIEPVQRGHELLSFPTYAFLIDHEPSGKRVMFDLGIRKDYWNLPAVLQLRFSQVIVALKVDEDVTEVLESGGIGVDSIDSVIWSHYHWDHIGNLELFPRARRSTSGLASRISLVSYPGFPTY